MSETDEALFARAAQAILQERERRGYRVAVEHARKAHGLAGYPIPQQLCGFVTQTRCLVDHRDGRQCLWVDFAFKLGSEFYVVLQSDLVRPGMFLDESAKRLLQELCERRGMLQ